MHAIKKVEKGTHVEIQKDFQNMLYFHDSLYGLWGKNLYWCSLSKHLLWNWITILDLGPTILSQILDMSWSNRILWVLSFEHNPEFLFQYWWFNSSLVFDKILLHFQMVLNSRHANIFPKHILHIKSYNQQVEFATES